MSSISCSVSQRPLIVVGMTRLPGLGMDTGAERGTQVRVLRLAPSMQLERTAITVTLESVLATVVVIVHWQLKPIGPDMPQVWDGRAKSPLRLSCSGPLIRVASGTELQR